MTRAGSESDLFPFPSHTDPSRQVVVMLFEVHDVNYFNKLPVTAISNVNDSVYIGTRNGIVVQVAVFRQERSAGEIKTIGRIECQTQIASRASEIKQLDAVSIFGELIVLCEGELAICSLQSLEVKGNVRPKGSDPVSRFALRGGSRCPHLCVAVGEHILVYTKASGMLGLYEQAFAIDTGALVSDLVWIDEQAEDGAGGLLCVAAKEATTVYTALALIRFRANTAYPEELAQSKMIPHGIRARFLKRRMARRFSASIPPPPPSSSPQPCRASRRR